VPAWRHGRNNVEVTQEPARKIEQVYSLVEKLSTPGQLRVASPLLLVARSAAVPVRGLNEEERAELAASTQLMGTADRRVESEGEANLQDAAGASRCGCHQASFGHISTHRFLA
jgi:hypothetical protein